MSFHFVNLVTISPISFYHILPLSNNLNSVNLSIFHLLIVIVTTYFVWSMFCTYNVVFDSRRCSVAPFNADQSARTSFFADKDSVATPHQLPRLRVIDTDKASSSTATSSTTPSDIHSAVVDPSSSILEPR
jgi:hypothetical protein